MGRPVIIALPAYTSYESQHAREQTHIPIPLNRHTHTHPSPLPSLTTSPPNSLSLAKGQHKLHPIVRASMHLPIINRHIPTHPAMSIRIRTIQAPALVLKRIAINITNSPVQGTVLARSPQNQLGRLVGVELVVFGEAEGVG